MEVVFRDYSPPKSLFIDREIAIRGMNATVVELQRRCTGCVSYTCIPNEYLTSRLNSMVVVVKDLMNEGQPGRRSDVEFPCRHVRVQRPRLCTGYHPVAVRRSDRSRTAVCTRKEDAAMSPLRRHKVEQCRSDVTHANDAVRRGTIHEYDENKEVRWMRQKLNRCQQSRAHGHAPVGGDSDDI